MLTLFTIPDASTIVSSSTAYSSTLFTEFLPIVYLAVGMTILGFGVAWLVKTLRYGVRKAFGSRGGRKMRRR